MRYFLACLLLLVFFSCKTKKEAVVALPDRKELLEVDRTFSQMSEEKGMKNAFIEYIDSNGALLRPDHMPIIGANAIDYLIQLNDTAFSLTWEPNGAEISRSGDLGYTYGVYEMKFKAKDSTVYGTYVSIWRKEKNGKWKFVLDTGNEGIGDNEQDNGQ